MSVMLELSNPAMPAASHVRPLVDTADATAPSTIQWRPYALIDSSWGLYELEWLALHIALNDSLPDSCLHDFAPYSIDGEAAFRRLRSLYVGYLNNMESNPTQPFGALLLGDVFAAASDPAAVEDMPERVWSPRDLLVDAERLIIAISEGIAAAPCENGLSHARQHAIVLRESCRAAILLEADLRVTHIPDWRPFDAPIYEYTAGVEGFAAFARVTYDRDEQIVIVWMASGYIYRITCDAIRSVDGVDGLAKNIVDVTSIFDGAAMRVQYEADASDWNCSRVLSVCEPLYFADDDLLQAGRPNHPRRVHDGCRRLAPLA